MKYTFHPHARREAASALTYYTSLDPQLGRDFLVELHNTINRIVARPVAWSSHSSGTRRCQLHRFPYSVIYKVSGPDIRIVAVMHQHRKPDYWLRRVDQ